MMPTPEEMLRMFDRYVSEGKDRVVAMAAVRSWVSANVEENTVEELAREAEAIQRHNDEAEWGPSIYEASLYHVTADREYSDSVGGLVADWLRSHITDPTPPRENGPVSV